MYRFCTNKSLSVMVLETLSLDLVECIGKHLSLADRLCLYGARLDWSLLRDRETNRLTIRDLGTCTVSQYEYFTKYTSLRGRLWTCVSTAAHIGNADLVAHILATVRGGFYAELAHGAWSIAMQRDQPSVLAAIAANQTNTGRRDVFMGERSADFAIGCYYRSLEAATWLITNYPDFDLRAGHFYMKYKTTYPSRTLVQLIDGGLLDHRESGVSYFVQKFIYARKRRHGFSSVEVDNNLFSHVTCSEDIRALPFRPRLTEAIVRNVLLGPTPEELRRCIDMTERGSDRNIYRATMLTMEVVCTAAGREAAPKIFNIWVDAMREHISKWIEEGDPFKMRKIRTLLYHVLCYSATPTDVIPTYTQETLDMSSGNGDAHGRIVIPSAYPCPPHPDMAAIVAHLFERVPHYPFTGHHIILAINRGMFDVATILADQLKTTRTIRIRPQLTDWSHPNVIIKEQIPRSFGRPSMYNTSTCCGRKGVLSCP